jgi:hypothetical protein
MNFAVGVLVLRFVPDVAQVHRDHCGFLFVDVQKLNQAAFQSIAKVHALL